MARGSEPAEGAIPATILAALYALAVVGVGLVAWAQVAIRADSGYLLDLYPLYRGAQALLEHGDAYMVQSPMPGTGGVTAIGNAYPLHAILILGMPFSWMAPWVAAVAWTVSVGTGWILAVWWARETPYWFLWIPMWQALLLQQPSAAVAVAAILALGALRKGAPWVLAISVLVLTTKPQQFLLLALVLAWWGRRWWRQMSATFIAVAAACFLSQPDWVARWLERVQVRVELVPVLWLAPVMVPLGVLLIWRGWRESGLAVASSAVGPWPAVGGYYSAAAWPLGAGRAQGAAMAALGIVGFLASEVLGQFRVFIVVVSVGLTAAAISLPRPRRSLSEFEGGRVRRPDRLGPPPDGSASS